MTLISNLKLENLTMNLASIVQRGWDAVAAGDFDALVADYEQDMKFLMPGQSDVLEGKDSFRAALNSLGQILPPGFEITGLRQIEGGRALRADIPLKEIM